MKVIFADIDGVLNSVSSMIYNNRLSLLGLTKTPTLESLNPIACSNLQYVLEELPDVKVIISSTWGIFHTLKSIQDIFETNNIFEERVIGITPDLYDKNRGEEIDFYLKQHPEVTDFVIIDDDSDMGPYMDRLVKVDSRNGLSFTDAEKVIEMLGRTNEENKE